MTGLGGGGALLGALTLTIAAAAASWMVTRWVTAALTRRRVLDHPNERSSHSAPTPRGGGIAILLVVLPLVAVIHQLHRPGDWTALAVVALAAVLGAISWLDDLRGLPAPARFAVHVGAVAAALTLMPDGFLVFQGWLAPWLDRLAAGLLWVWFINLYNFMDGIDGLAGVETAAVGIGLFAVVAVLGPATAGAGPALAQSALVTAAAAIGFLFLNWHPARVFMGDVGSITLGFLLGWFLLTLAGWGYWVAALTLPAYFIADATLTIVRRLLKGEAIWKAHDTHFYQRAVRRGFSHGRVARFVGVGNLFLLAIAVLSTQVVTPSGDFLCLAGAAAVAGFMLLWLARARPAAEDTHTTAGGA